MEVGVISCPQNRDNDGDNGDGDDNGYSYEDDHHYCASKRKKMKK